MPPANLGFPRGGAGRAAAPQLPSQKKTRERGLGFDAVVLTERYPRSY